jgi:hypothetical protein
MSSFYISVAVFGVTLLTLPGTNAQTIERVKLTDNDLSCSQIHAEVQQMETAMHLAGPGLPVPAPVPVPVAAAAAPLANAASGLTPLQGAVLVDPKVQEAVARARASGMSEAQINATLGVGMQRAGVGAPSLAQMHAPTAALMTQQGVSQGYQQEYARVMSQVQNNNAAAAPAPAPAGQAYAQAGGLAGMLGAGMSAQGGRGSNATGLAGMVGSLFGGGQAAAPAALAPVQALPVAAPAPAAGLGAQARARKDHLTDLFLGKGCRMSDLQK